MVKPITGKSKLQTRKKNKVKKQKITGASLKKGSVTTSYRLNPDDKCRMSDIVRAIDEIEPNKKISETFALKAMINYCTKIKPEKLLKAGREIGA
jgi:hypothetical protein